MYLVKSQMSIIRILRHLCHKYSSVINYRCVSVPLKNIIRETVVLLQLLKTRQLQTISKGKNQSDIAGGTRNIPTY